MSDKDLLVVISEILRKQDRHSEILNSQTKILDSHTEILNSQTEILNSQNRLLQKQKIMGGSVKIF